MQYLLDTKKITKTYFSVYIQKNGIVKIIVRKEMSISAKDPHDIKIKEPQKNIRSSDPEEICLNKNKGKSIKHWLSSTFHYILSNFIQFLR